MYVVLDKGMYIHSYAFKNNAKMVFCAPYRLVHMSRRTQTYSHTLTWHAHTTHPGASSEAPCTGSCLLLSYQAPYCTTKAPSCASTPHGSWRSVRPYMNKRTNVFICTHVNSYVRVWLHGWRVWVHGCMCVYGCMGDLIWNNIDDMTKARRPHALPAACIMPV